MSSQLTLYRRSQESPHWYAQLYVGSQRHRFSCKTIDKRTARRYAQQQAKKLRERHERGLLGLPEPVRVSEIFSRYEREYAPRLRPSARQRMLTVVGEACQWFLGAPGDIQVHHVTPLHIQAFLDHKRTEGVSPRTVNLYRANLHRVFQLCVCPWLLIPHNPVTATEPLREDQRDPRLLKDDEYEELRAACEPHPMLWLFVTLAWETGARTAELLQLEWSDIDFEDRSMAFINDQKRGRQTKGHQSRKIPLSGEALGALRKHAAEYRFADPPSPYLFKHVRRSRDAEPGQRIERVYRGLKSAARRTGMGDFRPHDLRHCFVTRKLAAGVPVQLVSRYVGHAQLSTTMRYTHLVAEHLRPVVEDKLPGYGVRMNGREFR